MFRITRILKNLFSLSSFKFILILWIIINISKVQSQFTLKRRFTHNAHLFDNKLWFFGGGTMVNGLLSPTGDVFYVDLTKPFDTANVPYVAKAASPFSCAWCQSAIGGVDQSKIFFFAGAMVKQDSPKTLTDTIVYSFDIKTQTWSIPPQMTGMTYSRRRELQPVSKNGKIYLFGGGADMSLGRPNIQVFNDMNILDSVNYIWTTGPSLVPPVSKIDYTATLLPNGNIIYIGGSRSDVNIIRFDAVSMNQIDMYNTNKDTWTTMMATGDNIAVRTGHTAVLNKKGEIIIFGGVSSPNLVASQPRIAVLNTSTNPFQWTSPAINTTEIDPPSLIFHTATLVENYMIVAFGNISRNNLNEPLLGQSDKLYVLDINTFTWIKNYNPPNNSTDIQELQSNNPLSKVLISIIVVVVVIIVIGVTAGVTIYRRKIKQSDDNLMVYQPNIMDQQILESQIDTESIYTSNSKVPVTSKDIYQRDIKQQPRIPSSLSETSSVGINYASDTNVTHSNNDTNHYVSNDNTARQYLGDNKNIAQQYTGNINTTRQYVGDNKNIIQQYAGNSNTIRQYEGDNKNIAHQYAGNNNNPVRQYMGDNNNMAHQYTSSNNTSTTRQNVGDNNLAHQYSSNDNTTRQNVSGNNNNTGRQYMGGNNNMANQYARTQYVGSNNNQYANNNSNMTRQYTGNNNTAHYTTDTNIAPANERFNLPPDQPYRVVMMNTQSGEMYIPKTSDYDNYNNSNGRFSKQ